MGAGKNFRMRSNSVGLKSTAHRTPRTFLRTKFFPLTTPPVVLQGGGIEKERQHEPPPQRSA